MLSSPTRSVLEPVPVLGSGSPGGGTRYQRYPRYEVPGYRGTGATEAAGTRTGTGTSTGSGNQNQQKNNDCQGGNPGNAGVSLRPGRINRPLCPGWGTLERVCMAWVDQPGELCARCKSHRRQERG